MSSATTTPCSPGTVNPEARQVPEVQVGMFMNSGHTACFDCGRACEHGASTPLPCETGTFGNATSLEARTSAMRAPSVTTA